MKNNNQFIKEAEKKYTQLINELLNKCFHEIEEYIYYALRCSYRCGIPIRPYYDDFTHIIQEHNTHAVVYPQSSFIPGVGIVNPLFFYGFKITDNGQIVFSEDPQILGLI